MLMIRLQRVGRKHDPSFRVVLTDSRRAAKSGSVLDVLGFYGVKQKNNIKLNGEKIKEWIAKGAQVSDTVHNLLVNGKIITSPKINVLPPNKKKAKTAEPAEQPTEAKEQVKMEAEKSSEVVDKK